LFYVQHSKLLFFFAAKALFATKTLGRQGCYLLLFKIEYSLFNIQNYKLFFAAKALFATKALGRQGFYLLSVIAIAVKQSLIHRSRSVGTQINLVNVVGFFKV
jgi:hypothetical protein